MSVSYSSSPADLPDLVLRYAPGEDGVIDVHLPSGTGPAALVVLLHGGFWRQAYDRLHTRPLATALREAGFVVATPEYRRVGGAGGGWPATAEDVDAALGAVPGLLAEAGVATTTVTLVGHSAGGHLVLWLANQPHPVDRVVALAPVGDLRAAARDGLGNGATQDLLGGGPEEVPQAYDEADPGTRLRTRPSCALVVVHGADDDVVPVANSVGLAARHPFVDLRVLGGVEHFGVIDPGSAAWPDVLAAVRGVAAG